MGILNGVIEWSKDKFLPYGPWGLFLLAFMESSFFPVPPDLLLIPLSLANPEKAFWFATIATVGSVLGGMFGYLIGYLGEKALLERFFSKNKIEKAHKMFDKYGAWAVFIAAFTPIPYKVFTITAGIFYINFRKFIIASMIGRGLRFFLEAGFIFYFGEKMVGFLDQNFNLITLLSIPLVVIIYLIYRRLNTARVL